MPCTNNYTCISNFGCTPDAAITNPLTYSIDNTVDQKMLHGSSAATVVGQYSKNSQVYLSNYCAANWDGFCELASRDTVTSYANNVDVLGLGGSCMGLTQGEMLIYNTARQKYLVDPGNKVLYKEPFDPNVANSPYIYYFKDNDCNAIGSMCGMSYGTGCGVKFAVNPNTIDSDPVMVKILCNPKLYTNLLVNIYHTMTQMGTINQLNGTQLGNYFNSYQFKSSLCRKC